MSVAARCGAQNWRNRTRPAAAAVDATGGRDGDAGCRLRRQHDPRHGDRPSARLAVSALVALPVEVLRAARACRSAAMAMIGVVRLRSMKPAAVHLPSRVSTEHVGVCCRVCSLLRVCGVRPRRAQSARLPSSSGGRALGSPRCSTAVKAFMAAAGVAVL